MCSVDIQYMGAEDLPVERRREEDRVSECMVQCATSAVVHTQRMSLSKEDEYVGPRGSMSRISSASMPAAVHEVSECYMQ